MATIQYCDYDIKGKLDVADTSTFNKQLTVSSSVGGDSSWDDSGILIENTSTSTGEPTVAFRNAGSNGTGSNYWFTGLNQNTPYRIAYGASFTDGNTKLELSTSGFFKFNSYGAGTLVSDANGNITSTSTPPGTGTFLPLAGGTMSGSIDMGDNDVFGIDELLWSSGTKIGDNGSGLLLLKSASATTSGLQFNDSDNTIQGYVYSDGGATSSFGLLDGTGSWAVRCLEDQYVELRYDNSVKLRTASTGVSITGNAAATGDLLLTTASSKVQITGSGFVGADDNLFLGTATSGTDHTYIGDTSRNVSIYNGAVFTVESGDVRLNGTGRIQGVDTVSSGTDAANKTYVDNAISGVPQGTVKSVTSGNTNTITIGGTTVDPTVAANTGTVSSSSSNLATGAQIQTAIDTATTGALKFVSEWDASGLNGGSPDLRLAATHIPGNYYIVSVAGGSTPNGSGTSPSEWAVGDWCIRADLATDTWQKIDNTQVGNVTGTGTVNELAIWGSTSAISSQSRLSFITSGVSGRVLVVDNAVKIIGATNYTGLEVKGVGASRPGINFTNANQGDLASVYATENKAFVITTGGSGSPALTLDSSQNATFAAHVFVEDGSKFFGANSIAASSEDGNYVASFGKSTSGSAKFAGNITVGTGNSTFGGDVLVEDNLYLTDSGTVRGRIQLNSSDRDDLDIKAVSLGSNMKFFTVDTERMRIDSSGNVAIGRTAASKRLDINLANAGQEGASIILRNTSAGSGAYNRIYFAPTSSDPNTRSAIIQGENVDGNNNMALVFKTSAGADPTEKMRISQTGAIKFNTYGAGTLVSDASGNITVSSGGGAGGPYLPLTGGTMTGDILMDGKAGVGNVIGLATGTSTNAMSLKLYTYNNIDPGGGLGIGTGNIIQADLGQNLVLRQTADDGDIIFQSDDGSGGITQYYRIDGGASLNVFSKDILLPDNVNSLYGSSSDLKIFHNGTNSHIQNATGDLYVENLADDKNIIFRSDDGAGGFAEYFRLDGLNGNIKFSVPTVHIDNKKALFGTSGDLEIFHDGTSSVINNKTGGLFIKSTQTDGNIVFEADNGAGSVVAYFSLDGGSAAANEYYTKWNDNSRIAFGNGKDLQIYHNATDSVIENLTGDLYITNKADNKDIIFRSDNGSGGFTTYLTIDGLNEIVAFSKNTRHFDNVRARFGNSSDLQIFHDGSNSFIQDTGTGDLYIDAATNFFVRNQGNGDVWIKATNAGVSLRYQDTQKLITTNTGVTVNGKGISDATVASDSSTTLATKGYVDVHGGGAGPFLPLAGGTMTGDTIHNDNVKSLFGNGNDLQIYHDGLDSFIKDAGTGNLTLLASKTRIQNPGGTATCADFTGGGEVELYFGGDKKFETSSTGVTISGICNTGTQYQVKDATGARYSVVGDTDTGLGAFDLAGGVSLVCNSKKAITAADGAVIFDNYIATAVATTGSLSAIQSNQAATQDTLAQLCVDPGGNVVRGSQEGTWTFTAAQINALTTSTTAGPILIAAPGANKAIIVEETNWMVKYSGTGSMATTQAYEIRQSIWTNASASISRLPSTKINEIMNSAQGTPSNPSYGFYSRDVPDFNNDARTYNCNKPTRLNRLNTNALPGNLVSISIKLKYRLFNADTF